jgi:hypothetical protein
MLARMRMSQHVDLTSLCTRDGDGDVGARVAGILEACRYVLVEVLLDIAQLDGDLKSGAVEGQKLRAKLVAGLCEAEEVVRAGGPVVCCAVGRRQGLRRGVLGWAESDRAELKLIFIPERAERPALVSKDGEVVDAVAEFCVGVGG